MVWTLIRVRSGPAGPDHSTDLRGNVAGHIHRRHEAARGPDPAGGSTARSSRRRLPKSDAATGGRRSRSSSSCRQLAGCETVTTVSRQTSPVAGRRDIKVLRPLFRTGCGAERRVVEQHTPRQPIKEPVSARRAGRRRVGQPGPAVWGPVAAVVRRWGRRVRALEVRRAIGRWRIGLSNSRGRWPGRRTARLLMPSAHGCRSGLPS